MRELNCVSDLALDEWSAGELSPAEAAQLHAHLLQCARCREQRAEYERERAAFLEVAPSIAAQAALLGRADATASSRMTADAIRDPASPRRSRAVARPRWRPAAWLGAALAAAAAVALVALGTPASSPGTRSKGPPHVDFFVKRGARVARGRAGQLLRAGDLLRFTVSSDRARYLALFDRDAHGARVYYPGGRHAAALRPGSAVPLDFSIELDDSLGPEHIYAVFCPEPFALEPLRGELARAGELSAPDGCQLDVLEIRKEARP